MWPQSLAGDMNRNVQRARSCNRVHDLCFGCSLLWHTQETFSSCCRLQQFRDLWGRTVAHFCVYNTPKEVLFHCLSVSLKHRESTFLIPNHNTQAECDLASFNSPLLVLEIKYGHNSLPSACQECLWPLCPSYTSFPSPSECPGTHQIPHSISLCTVSTATDNQCQEMSQTQKISNILRERN